MTKNLQDLRFAIQAPEARLEAESAM